MDDRALAKKRLTEYEDLIHQRELAKADLETQRRHIIGSNAMTMLQDLEEEVAPRLLEIDRRIESLKTELRDLAPTDGTLRGELYNLIRVESRQMIWNKFDELLGILQDSEDLTARGTALALQQCVKLTSYGKVDPIRDRRDSK